MAIGLKINRKTIGRDILAAILIYAGYQTIKPSRIRTVWRTNTLSATVMVVTFVATLFLPLQQAVLAGVVLHVILFVFQAAERVTNVELVPLEDGDFREQPAPAELPSNAVTILLPYGSLFYAGAADFEEEIPTADQAQRAVVVLILRGRENAGSTFLSVLKRYAAILDDNGGQLILSDVSEAVRDQLDKTGILENKYWRRKRSCRPAAAPGLVSGCSGSWSAAAR